MTVLTMMAVVSVSCNKMLDTKVYSVVENDNYWKTPDQIKAGVAPAYNALRDLARYHALKMLNAVSSDEMIVPTRGGDWGAGGIYLQEWLHTWTPTHPDINDLWGTIFSGIGNINFISSIVNGLPDKPESLDQINAELNTMRAYYYYLAMDDFGNVPIVKDFNTDPNTVTNSDRKDVYDFVESELKTSINQLPDNVDNSTYGRVTKWMAHCLLAKLYLNAQVYTGTPQWKACIAECDSIINSGKYSLQPNYFDNFSVDNEGSVENIFVVPLDAIYTGGMEWQWFTLHYQNNINFQLSAGPWNGGCSTADYYYSNFDTTSVYEDKGNNTYRSYIDSRTGQWLVGQQFSVPYTYPPNKDVLVESKDASLEIKDVATGLPLSFNPEVPLVSDPSAAFRLAGARNIKYFPEANAPSQSNDWVVFRLADIMLMKAEAELRSGGDLADALNLVNMIRERAYGDASHDWKSPDLTLDNILAERARELSWEGYRRQDLIRYEVASGKPYFAAARKPGKTVDPDDHYRIFPIPEAKIEANPKLKQNPGY